MAFNIEVDNKCKFQVRFTSKDQKGVDRLGTFFISAYKLPTDEFKTRMEACNLVYADFLATVVFDWEDVRDGDGVPVEFSLDALDKLCKIPGMAHLIWKLYSVESAVKEKN